MSGERSFPHGRVSLVALMTSWRAVAREAALLSPDTPEWQQLADEARHRRLILDEVLASTAQVQRDFRLRHPHPHAR
jgi:hypothetical protein